MRRIITIFAAIFLLSLPAKADEAAIQDVITRQIDAFQADDFETAFTFASPTIQGIFRDPDVFGNMVREGYPMVWRPADVQFLTTDLIAGKLWQSVLMRDQAGQVHILEYEMIRIEDSWKINAVRLRQDTEGTA